MCVIVAFRTFDDMDSDRPRPQRDTSLAASDGALALDDHGPPPPARGGDADDEASEQGEWRRGVGQRLRTVFRRPEGSVVSGLSADLAAALGFDALWVRLGFVLLALVGGIGILLYAGLWLALVPGATSRIARLGGGAVLLGVVPIVILNADRSLIDGTPAIVVLLVGLTLALWQPTDRDRPVATAPSSTRRVSWDTPSSGTDGQSASGSGTDGSSAPDAPAPTTDSAVGNGRDDRRPFASRRDTARDRRPPSPMGRATFGLAVLIAAVGALVDELNGGRLHPEQWLGAAAIVCGLGLAIGVLRGHGRWLIVPAVVFAAVGYGGGILARAGVSLDSLQGQNWVYIDREGLSSAPDQEVGFGDTDIRIEGIPTEPVVVSSRTGVGDVRLWMRDDATVEIRGDLDDGRIRVDGEVRPERTVVVGADGPVDVTVDARVVRGDVEVTTFDAERYAEDAVGADPPIEYESPGGGVVGDPVVTIGPDPATEEGTSFLDDGQTMMTSDGTVLLSGGEALIDVDNQPVGGEFAPLGDRGFRLRTMEGEWTLVDDLLITPFGETLELDRVRVERGIVSFDDLAERGEADPSRFDGQEG